MGDSAKDEVTLDTVRWISLLNTDMWKPAGFRRRADQRPLRRSRAGRGGMYVVTIIVTHVAGP